MIDSLAWQQALWSALLALAMAGLVGAYLLNSWDGPLRTQGIARVSAVLLLVAELGYLRSATISMTDVSDTGFSDAMWLILTQTHFGAMQQLSAIATLMLLVLLFLPRIRPADHVSSIWRIWRVLYGMSLIAMAVARAGAGHAIDRGMFSGAVFNDAVHILAACAWVGVAGCCCLAALQWQTWSHTKQVALTRRVSSIATVALLAVGLTGALNVLRMLDVANLSMQMPYTRMLAFKLGGVAIAVTLGAYNRWISMPRMQLYPGSAGRRFVQVLIVETMVLGLVMMAATSLGTMMPPM